MCHFDDDELLYVLPSVATLKDVFDEARADAPERSARASLFARSLSQFLFPAASQPPAPGSWNLRFDNLEVRAHLPWSRSRTPSERTRHRARRSANARTSTTRPTIISFTSVRSSCEWALTRTTPRSRPPMQTRDGKARARARPVRRRTCARSFDFFLTRPLCCWLRQVCRRHERSSRRARDRPVPGVFQRQIGRPLGRVELATVRRAPLRLRLGSPEGGARAVHLEPRAAAAFPVLSLRRVAAQVQHPRLESARGLGILSRVAPHDRQGHQGRGRGREEHGRRGRRWRGRTAALLLQARDAHGRARGGGAERDRSSGRVGEGERASRSLERWGRRPSREAR